MAKKKKEITPSVILHADGSYKSSTNMGGYATLMESGGHKLVINGNEVGATNNFMELHAIVAGLSMLNRPCNVKVVSDSQYAVNSINSWIKTWKRNNWVTKTGKPVSNLPEMLQLDELSKTHNIKAFWVKAHNGHPENELADQLATLASSKKNT